MCNVEADQCRLTYALTTNHYLVNSIAQDGCVRCQVGTYRDSPYSNLVPGKEIASKAQEQGYEEKSYANNPVKLTRGLVGAMIEDADHMQRYRNNHQVGR